VPTELWGTQVFIYSSSLFSTFVFPLDRAWPFFAVPFCPCLSFPCRPFCFSFLEDELRLTMGPKPRLRWWRSAHQIVWRYARPFLVHPQALLTPVLAKSALSILDSIFILSALSRILSKGPAHSRALGHSTVRRNNLTPPQAAEHSARETPPHPTLSPQGRGKAER
jgi:hypothetical protein